MHTPSQMAHPNCTSGGVRHLGWRTLSNNILIPLHDKKKVASWEIFFSEWQFEKIISGQWQLCQSLVNRIEARSVVPISFYQIQIFLYSLWI